MNGPLQVVWFKRDLRIADHKPLLEASRLGAVLPLYVVEPHYWQQSDCSGRQWQFCAESLLELRLSLARLGQPLVVRCGQVEQVLERAHHQFGIAGLWSHEETGNGFTYARDLRVAAWARRHSIKWNEFAQFGVIRGLKNRKGWARRWEGRMAEMLAPPPERLIPLEGIEIGEIPSAHGLGLEPDLLPRRQHGGSREAVQLLSSFLTERSRRYQADISSPITAAASCSRLSPHLSWGTLSLREVVQLTRKRRFCFADSPAERSWSRSLQRFDNRLHWHCHFIQKLESKPSLEYQELYSGRFVQRSSNEKRLKVWALGCTGLPFVDACMRSLIATGWLNFRMRAMLISVASYQLLLPWRESGMHLARLFIDYEPGIHWSQCQMQSGTTGNKTVRIYNPLKQGLDHDLSGNFIRRWLPELRRVPAVYLHQPWTMDPQTQDRVGCVIGSSYPKPIVSFAKPAKPLNPAQLNLFCL